MDLTCVKSITVVEFLANCIDVQLVEVKRQVEADVEMYSHQIRSICTQVNPGAEAASADLLAEMDTDLRNWVSCIRLESCFNDDQWSELGKLFNTSCDRHSPETQRASDIVSVGSLSGSRKPLWTDDATHLVQSTVSLEDALAVIRGEVESHDLEVEVKVTGGTHRKQWDPPDLQMVFAAKEASDEEDDRCSAQSDREEQSTWIPSQHQLQISEPTDVSDDGFLVSTDVSDLPAWARTRVQSPELPPVESTPAVTEINRVPELQVVAKDRQSEIERTAPLTAIEEMQRKLELIETVIEPIVSVPAHSGYWMDLYDLTRDLLEEISEGREDVDFMRKQRRQVERRVGNELNNQRECIDSYRADTLAGDVPMSEVLQLVSDDNMFKLLEQHDTFLQALDCLGWRNVKAALICQQQELRDQMIEYVSQQLRVQYQPESGKFIPRNAVVDGSEPVTAMVAPPTTIILEPEITTTATVPEAEMMKVALETPVEISKKIEEHLDALGSYDGTGDIDIFLV